MHCRWYSSMPCSRGVLLLGGLLWGVAFCYGLLLWSSVMVFWFGPSVEGGLLVWSSGGHNRRHHTRRHHNRRPPQQKAPHQKANTPEGHNRRCAWWRFPPGPHPGGKLRGIRSRARAKGEIEGDQVQGHSQGGNEGDQIQAHTQGGN